MTKTKRVFSAQALASVLGLFVFLVAFLLGFKKVYDGDVWWHLTAGRWMVEHRSFIHVDPFSYTFRGRPWVDLTWGYEVLLYFLSRLVGNGFLVVSFMAFVSALTAWVSWDTLRALRPRLESFSLLCLFFLFLFGLGLVEWRWNHRPEQLTMLFGAVFLNVLIKNDLRLPQCLLLILVQIVWVNTHGLFILGPFLVGLFWIAQLLFRKGSANRMAALGVGVSLACLANPLGLKGALFPAHLWSILMNRFYQTAIPETSNPLSGGTWSGDARLFVLYASFLLVVFLFWNFRFGKVKRWQAADFAFLILSVVLFRLSLSARRNTALFALWTLPWLGAWLSDVMGKVSLTPKVALRIAGVSTLFAAVMVCINLWPRVGNSSRFGYSDLQPNRPLAKAIESFPRKVRFFTGEGTANTLLWSLPGFEPYSDSRHAEVYDLAHFRHYMDILAHPWMIDEEVGKYGIEAIGVEFENSIEIGLIQFLGNRKDWTPVFIAENGILFLKSNTAREFSSKGWKVKTLSELFEEAVIAVQRTAKDSFLFDFKNEQDRAAKVFRLASIALDLDRIEISKTLQEVAKGLGKNPEMDLELKCLTGYRSLEKDLKMISVPLSISGNMNRHAQGVGSVQTQCQEAFRKYRLQTSLMALGVLHFNSQRLDLSKREFEEILDRDPINYDANLFLARVVMRMGAAPLEIEQRYLRAAQLRPYDDTALSELRAWSKMP